MATPATRPTRGRRTPRLSGDEREREMLEAFERLLEQRPLHALSVDDIARGAGISRPTFYFYFASKEAVLLSLLERMLAEARADRDAAFARLAEDDPARWRQGIASFYEIFRSHRAVTLAGADARAASDEVRALWSRVTTSGSRRPRGRSRPSGPAAPPPPGWTRATLATTLVLMNERVLHASFAGHEPAVAEDEVLDVLLTVWMKAVYG